MATIRKRRGKYSVSIRRLFHKPIYKTFSKYEDGKCWASDSERQLERGLYEDLTEASRTTLAEVLERYGKDKIPSRKSQLTPLYMIKKISRHTIRKLHLTGLTTLKLVKYRDEIAAVRSASTANKYLTLISVALKVAMKLQQALDKGKGYLINSIMVLIDEAKSSGKREEKQLLLNTMETIMTEGSVGIRQLYKEYTEQDFCSNYWINTNHKDAFALPPNEVRYWVYFSPAKRNGKLLEDFHKARYNDNLAAGVYAELLDRDVSKFDPLGVAPWTEYRDEMTELADKPLNDYVKEGYEQGVYPLDRSLVTTTELFHYWQDKSKIKITRERDVAAALQLLRPKPTRVRACPVVDVGATVNIWIIRDHEKYKKYTAKDLGKIYQGFWVDSQTDTKKIDKAEPFTRPVFKNATKAGEIDFEKNEMDKIKQQVADDHDEY